jgi:hypothetical protein
MVTSFIYDHVAAKATGEENITADIMLDDTLPEPLVAELSLPVGNKLGDVVDSDIYGLARATLSPETALSTNVITNDFPNSLVANEWGIDVHLYKMEGQPNLQGLVEGDMVFAEIADWSYAPSDAKPGQLVIPLATDTLLTVKNVRDTLSVETVTYTLDYVTLQLGEDSVPARATDLDDANRRIRNEDAVPQVFPLTFCTDRLTALNARIFRLGAFSIRVGIVPDVNPCFIATAAYGTPMAAEIDTLRDLRDTFMLNNAAGTAFVDMYYRVSPTFAAVVAKSPVLAAVVRVMLTPVVWLARIMLAAPVSALLMASAALAVLYRRRRFAQSP